MATLLLAATQVLATDVTPVPPSGCDNLDDIPITYDIEYNAAIQGLFNSFDDGGDACSSCHLSPTQGNTPSGDLDLTPGVSWSHLINVNSAQTTALLLRVVPNHPEQSLLFQKVNCDTPPLGVRMPDGFAPLSREQQALIYDWIAGGAPVGATQGIFRSGFESATR